MPGVLASEFAAIVATLPSSKGSGSSVLSPGRRQEAADILGPSPLDWAAAAAYHGTLIAASHNADDLHFPFDQVRAASEDMLVGLLVELAGDGGRRQDVPGRLRPVPIAPVQGVSVDRIIWTIRLLQRYWTERLLDHANRSGTSRMVVGDLALAIAEAFDRSIDNLVRRPTGNRAGDRRAALAERRRLVEAIVAGRPADTAAVRHFLHVDITDHHVGVVVAAPEGVIAESSAADGLVGAVEAALPEAKVLLHHATATETYLWVSCPRPPSPVLVGSALSGTGLRIGIGSPHSGAGGFRRTHLEGLDAERVARWSRQSVVRHAEVGVAGLAVADLERTRWFVARHLGDLAVDTPYADELRQTVRAYLRNRMRLVDTSAELHLHRNSVTYRLRRVDELLGYRPVERLAELSCALVLAEVFPADVLRPGS